MKTFKGTWLFGLIVVFAVGFMVYDYKSQQAKEQAEQLSRQLLPDYKFENLKAFSLLRPEQKYRIEKQDEVFVLVEPVKDGVALGELESHVTGLATQEVRAVDVEGTVDWAQYGLETPVAVLSLTAKDGKETKISVGSVRSYDDGYYVRIDDQNKLLLASTSLSPYVSKTANELRVKELYKGSADYLGLEILSKSGRLKFLSNNGNWTLDGDKNFKISISAVNEYINVLRHMEADAIVAEAGDQASLQKYNLLRPELVVEIKNGKADAPETWVAKFSAKKNDEVFVHVGNDRPIYKVQPRKLESLLKSKDDFRNREFPFGFDHLNLGSLELKRAAETQTTKLVKKDGKWTEEDPAASAQKTVLSEKVDELLNDLRQLKVDTFLKGADARRKIKDPGHLVATNSKGEVVFAFQWGEERTPTGKSDALYLARSSLFDENFLVNKNSVHRLETLELYKKPEPTPEVQKK
jgi:hypothetical protein